MPIVLQKPESPSSQRQNPLSPPFPSAAGFSGETLQGPMSLIPESAVDQPTSKVRSHAHQNHLPSPHKVSKTLDDFLQAQG